PVMNLTEGDVGAALNTLEENKLVARDDFGGRVPKWRHHFHNQLLLKAPVMAVLATLMLRGPQTLSELRANATVLGGPADAEGANQVLQDLADRAQPLVTLLSRGAGQSSLRYAHTLSGEAATPFSPEQISTTASAVATTPTGEKISLTDLYERIRVLEAKVADLEQRQTSAE
ncbi:MAG: DUF480 domain-containing protein, partial [Chthoniobacterales bacterium]